MAFGRLLGRLGVILAMLCVLVPLTSGMANATSAYYTAPYLPWGIAGQNVCFGGERCGATDTVTVEVPKMSYIGYVEVEAHDNVGDRTRAHLQVWVDGHLYGEQDVQASGSTLIFPIVTLGTQIVFRSIHEDGAHKTEETVLQRISVWDRCYC